MIDKKEAHFSRYSATKAGRYALEVTSSADGEQLPGSPFCVDVTPAALSPQHCAAALAADRLEAGAEAVVNIDARDEHGNQVRPVATVQGRLSGLRMGAGGRHEPLGGTSACTALPNLLEYLLGWCNLC